MYYQKGDFALSSYRRSFRGEPNANAAYAKKRENYALKCAFIRRILKHQRRGNMRRRNVIFRATPLPAFIFIGYRRQGALIQKKWNYFLDIEW